MIARFSVAPMMDWTDRHCRVFLRCFSPDALLYTEMVTAAAILRGNRERLLRYCAEEQPLALQLGGSSPGELAEAAQAGEQAGYREINLNCGCPSDRVHAGSFGACLMLRPQRVAECVASMRAAVRIPVTVKMRIGVVEQRQSGSSWAQACTRFDENDYARLHEFTDQVISAGCQGVIVHARKAVLGGLSPHDNRTVPPLRFDVVRRLRLAFPGTPFAVNGGIRDCTAAADALKWCDSVMIGREAYHRPYLLSELQAELVPSTLWSRPTPQAVLRHMADYADAELARGERLSAITRHVLGLLSHAPGARDYRRLLSEGARDPGASGDLLRRAACLLEATAGGVATI